MPCAFRQGKYHHCVLPELKDTPKVRHLLSNFSISVFLLSPCQKHCLNSWGIQVSGNNVSVYLTCIGFIDHRLQRKVPRRTKFPSETENYINTRYVEI